MIKMHKGIYYHAYYNYDDNGEKAKALEEIHGYIIQYDNVQYGAVWTGKEWHLTDLATGNRLTTVYPFKSKKYLFYFIERESENLKKHHAHNHKEIDIFNDLLSDLLKKEHAE